MADVMYRKEAMRKMCTQRMTKLTHPITGNYTSLESEIKPMSYIRNYVEFDLH